MSDRNPSSFKQLRDVMDQPSMRPPSILAKIRDFLPRFATPYGGLVHRMDNSRHLDQGAMSSNSGISIERVDISETDESDDESSDQDIAYAHDEQHPQNIQFEIFAFQEPASNLTIDESTSEDEENDENITDEQERLPQAFKRKRCPTNEPTTVTLSKKLRLIEEL